MQGGRRFPRGCLFPCAQGPQVALLQARHVAVGGQTACLPSCRALFGECSLGGGAGGEHTGLSVPGKGLGLSALPATAFSLRLQLLF